jgi:hypothetical protein
MTNIYTDDELVEHYREALERIAQWHDAYPEDIFPKPTKEWIERAHTILLQHNMTLDRFAADCMRHVAQGMGRIAKDALDG